MSKHPADGWKRCMCYVASVSEPIRDPGNDRVLCSRCRLPIVGEQASLADLMPTPAGGHEEDSK